MCRNAGPVVCNRDAEQAGDWIETAGHIYPSRCGPVLQGLLRIDYQVEQHLMQLVSVGGDEREYPGRGRAPPVDAISSPDVPLYIVAHYAWGKTCHWISIRNGSIGVAIPTISLVIHPCNT